MASATTRKAQPWKAAYTPTTLTTHKPHTYRTDAASTALNDGCCASERPGWYDLCAKAEPCNASPNTSKKTTNTFRADAAGTALIDGANDPGNGGMFDLCAKAQPWKKEWIAGEEKKWGGEMKSYRVDGEGEALVDGASGGPPGDGDGFVDLLM